MQEYFFISYAIQDSIIIILLFKSSLSTIIEHKRDNANKETAYPCLGVFVDSVSKRFVVAHPKLINNVLNLKRHSDNEASKVVEQVLSKALPDNLDQIRTLTACYIRLPTFFPTPIESVLPLCYGITMPFVYELISKLAICCISQLLKSRSSIWIIFSDLY